MGAESPVCDMPQVTTGECKVCHNCTIGSATLKASLSSSIGHLRGFRAQGVHEMSFILKARLSLRISLTWSLCIWMICCSLWRMTSAEMPPNWPPGAPYCCCWPGAPYCWPPGCWPYCCWLPGCWPYCCCPGCWPYCCWPGCWPYYNTMRNQEALQIWTSSNQIGSKFLQIRQDVLYMLLSACEWNILPRRAGRREYLTLRLPYQYNEDN